MVTVIGIWEPGFSEYEQIIEWRVWKQTIAAYAFPRWIMVGTNPPNGGTFEQADTMDDALAMFPDSHLRIFMDVSGAPILGFTPPTDPLYIFGATGKNPVVQYKRQQDSLISVPQLTATSQFACAILPIVLAYTM